MMKITNTVTGKREIFKALSDHTILLYVCGVTPYNDAHIGHGRCYVIFDMVVRFFTFLEYQVKYCRNITDIDDKLLHAAYDQYGDRLRFAEIAQKYIESFQADMTALNCLPPTYEPKVTTHIAQIIEFIEALIEKGYAYQEQSDVYFEVKKFPQYGLLSKQKLDELYAGARVHINEKKRDPLDFVLWKGESEGEFWQSPWGWGRPGWHIECSALAATYLGSQLDIHAGGLDLIFPHHENEIAQSECRFGVPFAHYWMHNGLVRVDQQKMSKSLGNFITLKDAFVKCDPMVLRFYLLSHHYRAPFEFSWNDLEGFEKSYRRLIKLFAQETITSLQAMKESPLVGRLLEALKDDFNTAEMWGIIFSSWQILQENSQERAAVYTWIVQVMGLSLAPLKEKVIREDSEIQLLLQERESARRAKNWKRADELREELKQKGVEVHDTKL